MNKSDLKNGMIVTLRRGVERIVVGKCLFSELGNPTNMLENYNNDLTYINNCTSEDIMKIEYGGKVIWERGVEWEKVPMGTKVRAWDEEDEDKQVGRFIYHDEDEGYEFPFLVFVKSDKSEKYTNWYKNCEIIKEGEEV